MQSDILSHPAPVRWGVLGVADIGIRLVIPAILSSPDEQLVAIASRNPERAKERLAHIPDLRIYGDYERLLNDPEIEAVYIPLPNSLHAEWTIRALEAGKHVPVEKPLAPAVAHVDRIQAAAARASRVATEALMYPHHPLTRAAQAIVTSGRLGAVRGVRCAFAFPP